METTKITRCNIGKQIGFAWYATNITSYVRLMGGITVEVITDDIKMFTETAKNINSNLVNSWLKQLIPN